MDIILDIYEFCLKQHKRNLVRKKPRAAIFVLNFRLLNLAPLTRVGLARGARE